MQVEVEDTLFGGLASRRNQVHSPWLNCHVDRPADLNGRIGELSSKARVCGPEIRDMSSRNYQRVTWRGWSRREERKPGLCLGDDFDRFVFAPCNGTEWTIFFRTFR